MEEMDKALQIRNVPYVYPSGAENCTSVDEVKTRPAVAKSNWFDKMMCFFGVHDAYIVPQRNMVVCDKCDWECYLEDLR